jgi:hypothetical protein
LIFIAIEKQQQQLQFIVAIGISTDTNILDALKA